LGNTNKALLFILIIVIVALVAAIVYLAIVPAPHDKFTEFYLLNSEGQASKYPAEIISGKPVTIIVGVVNHEGTPVSYKVQAVADGAIINSIVTGQLSNGQKWEQSLTFSLSQPGNGKRIQFYLYLEGQDQPHIKDPLVLTADVISPK
jgi:uncharacterized membrane protein